MKASPDQETLKARFRHLCKTDLFFLLVWGLRRPDADNDWCFERCREVQANPDNHLDLWFRGGYKSTIITFALTIQNILNDPELTFGIFSFSRPIAKQFLRQIKMEFEQNGMLNWAFDDILWGGKAPSSVKWSEDDGIVVRRKGNPKESTVEAWGLVDGMPTSKHFKRIIYDDVVTIDTVSTPDQMKKTTGAWRLSRNLVAKQSASRVIGTRYHYFDSYAEISKAGFTVRKYAATKDGTPGGEPWIHTREELAKKVVEMQEHFSPQMMQEPRLATDAYFKPDWWKRYVALPRYANVYIGCDFAVTKLAGDYTVFVVVYVDPQDRMYVAHVHRVQGTSDEWVEVLLDLVKHFEPMAVGVPIDQIQKAIGPFLKKRALERRIFPHIVELPEAGSDKVAKARSFQGRAAMGMVYLPAQVIPQPDGSSLLGNGTPCPADYVVPAWLADLEPELDMFPMGQNDDQVDGLSIIGRLLDQLIAGSIPVAPTEPLPRDYDGGAASRASADHYEPEADPMLA